MARHVDRSVRRRAIKTVIVLESLYVLAGLVVHFALPTKYLTSTLALSLLSGGLVLGVAMLIYWIKHTDE